MSHPPRADLDALVQSLLGAGVEFIVVGGAAAVLHGAAGRARDKLVLPILLALRDRLG
jgi:hypothetical protein